MFVSLLDSDMSKPPAVAGGLMRIGSGALAPSGTVTGPRTIIAFETATVNVPCVKPDADARNIVLPSATPLTAPVACVWPEGIVTFGVSIPSTAVLSDESVTTSPPAGAGVDSVIVTFAVCPTPTGPGFT